MAEIEWDIISEYSVEEAVSDGVLMRLGDSGKLLCSVAFAHEVAGCWELHHDGKLAKEYPALGKGAGSKPARYRSENEALQALQRMQGQSWDYAMKHGGWRITEAVDPQRLKETISSLVGEYVSGNYCAPKRASDYPEEADAALAYYLIDSESGRLAGTYAPDDHAEVRVWLAGPGDGSLTIMLPEDY